MSQMTVREIQKILEGTGFKFQPADLNSAEAKAVMQAQTIAPTRSEVYCIVDAQGKLAEFPEQLREKLLASKEVKKEFVNRIVGQTLVTSAGDSVIWSREGQPIAGPVAPGDIIEYSVTKADTVRAIRTSTDPATGAVEVSDKFVWVSTADASVITGRFDSEEQFLRAHRRADALLEGEKAKQQFVAGILAKAADPNVSLADALMVGQKLGITA